MAILEQTAGPRSDQVELVNRQVEALLAENDPKTTKPVDFLRARFDAGLAWVWFPRGDGGLGVDPALQIVAERAFMDARAPNEAQRNPIGYGMGAPTIQTHGTPEQRKRYLRPLFTCEEIWCQLFS